MAQMTQEEFERWADGAPAGEAVAYHKGNLAHDRFFRGQHVLADAAWAAHMDGWVELVQARIKAGVCLYLAVKRRRRRVV